ncbi:DUF4811 domain-containing protein [Weissella confusa]|uniref:DUF4811 domain-containing protein n=1 Tax=Weissella confusa TaxID=1583 RepID=A0A923SNQ6_WEICO|nr:DUF4811 domain-containing protein [Weissella confusa]
MIQVKELQKMVKDSNNGITDEVANQVKKQFADRARDDENFMKDKDAQQKLQSDIVNKVTSDRQANLEKAYQTLTQNAETTVKIGETAKLETIVTTYQAKSLFSRFMLFGETKLKTGKTQYVLTVPKDWDVLTSAISGTVLAIAMAAGLYTAHHSNFLLTKVPLDKTQKIKPAATLLDFKFITTEKGSNGENRYTYKVGNKCCVYGL